MNPDIITHNITPDPSHMTSEQWNSIDLLRQVSKRLRRELAKHVNRYGMNWVHDELNQYLTIDCNSKILYKDSRDGLSRIVDDIYQTCAKNIISVD